MIVQLRSFGRYEIEGLLGEGAMGTVYRAYDARLRRPVALKVLKSLASASPIVRRRFEREARAAARLAHPNVVALHEAGQIDGKPYLVMEIVEGEPFDRLLARKGGDLVAKLRILEKVARGVHHAHERGVVHRDLKPANILVAAGGEPKVGDFGLAHLDHSTAALTRSGAVLGTPQYMAPEQVAGRSGAIDARTDVYALGVMLYEIITGRTPFRAETPVTLYAEILTREPERPSRLHPAVARDLEVICLRAMARERSRRYPSAAALADDLARHLRGEPIQARPPSVWYRTRRAIARRRTAITAVVAAVVIAAVAVRLVAARQADLSEQQRGARLQARLRPLEEAIAEARLLFYVEGIDMRDGLDRVRRALVELERLSADPEGAESREVWTALGVGWYLLENVERAERALERAAALAPEDARVRHYLGRICLEHAARAPYERAGEAETDWRRRGRDWAERALTHLQRSAGGWHGASELDLHVATACRALARGAQDEAQRLCLDGLASFGDAIGTEEYWAILGTMQRGEPRVDAFTRALRRRPHYARAFFMRGTGHDAMGRSEDAVADYTEALRLNPRFAEAYNNRGLGRKERGDLKGAVADFDAALCIRPRYVAAFTNRGIARYDQHDFDGAIADYDAALAIDAADAAVLVNRGNARAQKGDSPGALADFDAALRIDPDRVEAWYGRAITRERAGDLRGAIAEYDRAVAVRPDYAHALLNRGVVYGALGEVDRAIADYTQALSIRPEYVRAYSNRGTMRLTKGDVDGALVDYEAALRIDPRSAEARTGRGYARQLKGDLDGALRDHDAAIELNERMDQAFNNRGWARQAKGDSAGALTDFAEAIRLNPRNTQALCNRAYLRRDLGDRDGACADLARALEVAPAGWPHRAAVERNLAEIEAARR